jgi:putative protease
LKPGDGIVFDEGHPEQDEQGGRVFAVQNAGRNTLRIELGHGDVNLHAIAPGSIVWKTDDPQLRKRLEHSFSRDVVVNRIPVDATLEAHVGAPAKLTLRLNRAGRCATGSATSSEPLQAANKHPINEATAREQFSRLGDTPFELRELMLNTAGAPMIPKSVLNDLRRRATDELTAHLERDLVHPVIKDNALEALRNDASVIHQTPSSWAGNSLHGGELHVLCRTLEQVEAAVALHPDFLTSIYCDFEDVRRYKLAVERCAAAKVPIAVATMRIIKPHEEGWLEHILRCNPTAIIVRNLAAIGYYQEKSPQIPLIGDFSLNIANELTAKIFADAGLIRFVPSYDLNWQQMSAMLAQSDPQRFECVVHQHMPMFHMEHCVFAHTLSSGRDYRDCGRPCELHKVDLRDRVGMDNPLIPDAGCRNTVYNGQAQSAAEFIPRMQSLGIRHFRIELLRQNKDEVTTVVQRYAEMIQGRVEPAAAVRSLRVLHQLGVTAGTLLHE